MGALRNRLEHSRRWLIALTLAAALSFGAAGCGSSSYGSGDGSNGGGDDPANGLVPDYQTPVRKAQDASDLANQKQKEAEENVRQMEAGP